MKVIKMEKRKAFSLYLNDEPIKIEDKPLTFEEGLNIKIGNTVFEKELTWFIFYFDDGHIVWYCDRNLVNWINKKTLEQNNLIKKHFSADNCKAELSLPDAGDNIYTECEWDAIMDFLNGDEENLLHWDVCFSLGLGAVNDHIPARGSVDAYGYYQFAKTLEHRSVGWRPVLRNVNHDKEAFFALWNAFLRAESRGDVYGADARLWQIAGFLKTKL